MINFKKGFTLAEILITLAVIGVIATITIPSVITHRNEAETVAKVKKFYSTMEEAYRLSRIDNGPAPFWRVPNGWRGSAEPLGSYIVPYLNVMKDCKTDFNCFGYPSPFRMKLLNGNTWSTDYSSDIYYKVILLDNSYLWFRSTERYCEYKDGGVNDLKTCAVFWYDANGPKAPNTIGKDIFYLFLTKDEGIKPPMVDDCQYGRTDGDGGWGCLTYILRNDDMKYPKK